MLKKLILLFQIPSLLCTIRLSLLIYVRIASTNTFTNQTDWKYSTNLRWSSTSVVSRSTLWYKISKNNAMVSSSNISKSVFCWNTSGDENITLNYFDTEMHQWAGNDCFSHWINAWQNILCLRCSFKDFHISSSFWLTKFHCG